MDEAKAALAEARRLNPAITIKWMKELPNLPAVFDGLRRAGCRRSERRQRAEAGAMLVACRLAGLSALEAHYPGPLSSVKLGGHHLERPKPKSGRRGRSPRSLGTLGWLGLL